MFNYYYQHEETQGDNIIDKFETNSILYILRKNNEGDSYLIERIGTPNGIFKTGSIVDFADEFDSIDNAKKEFEKLREKEEG